jgi:hypothetical protein
LDLLHHIHSHNSGLQAIQRPLYSSHFTVHRYTRTSVLCLHESYPGNGFITVLLSLQITHEVFFSPTNSLVAISSQSPSTAISRTNPILNNKFQAHIPAGWRLGTQLFAATASFGTLYNHLHGPRRKHSLYTVGKVCLQLGCLAIDIILLRALAPSVMCLPGCCLEMGIHVTI